MATTIEEQLKIRGQQHIEKYMAENVKNCCIASMYIANLLRRVEKGQVEVRHAADVISMWNLGSIAKGVSRSDRFPHLGMMYFSSEASETQDFNTSKILHYVVVRQFRRHKWAANQILRALPYAYSAEFFGGREEMLQFLKRVRREMELPA